MKKITRRLLILSVVLLAVLVVPRAFAQDTGAAKLDDNQKVIINKQITGAVPIGKSGFYSITVQDLRASNASGDVSINPVLDYQASMTVNDPLEPQQYLTLLDAETAWDEAADSTGQVVAVIDGGFALNHEDLTNRWATNAGEIGETVLEGDAPNCTSRVLTLDKSCNNLDDDENGYFDDWRGWDFSGLDNEPLVGTTNPTGDGTEHGTIVAGLIGVDSNNSLGSASLNWQSKILPLQVMSDDGYATTLQVAEAIDYAIGQNVSVINISLGSLENDPTIDELLITAKEAGIVVVAAAGNCGGSTYYLNGCEYEGQMLYPAFSGDAIAVGASMLDDGLASFSSRGPALDVVAPGYGNMISSDYLSTDSITAYSDEIYGTSFATPIVSGLMAILKAQWPTATVDQLRAVLVDGALKTSGMSDSLYTTSWGFGRIQPVRSIQLAEACSIITLASDINCDDSVNLSDLSALASQWQMQYTGRTDGNFSGLVDLSDLSLLASQWGQ
ncbi:MAG: S8 family serine peptidase [Candidatus Saccharimonadales bacterium]